MIENVSKDKIVMLQNISISNKCWSFELSTNIWSSTTVFKCDKKLAAENSAFSPSAGI